VELLLEVGVEKQEVGVDLPAVEVDLPAVEAVVHLLLVGHLLIFYIARKPQQELTPVL
jgi:hypothetical protein